ncbi:MAG TPA: Mur ligase family protein [Acidimicrobiales bacterium]|nr:Mur ligase family protein [Acidimicrobiales bacterium]
MTAKAVQRSDFTGTDVVLLGVGVETLSVLPHLAPLDVGALRIVETARPTAEQARQLEDNGIDSESLLAEVPDSADVVLRSPGFPRHRPDVDALYEHARFGTTPTGLWLAARGPRGTVVVTGTKGKSSTATMIAAGLEHCGVPAFLAGNIGTAAWSHDPHRDGVAVVELSSYQGADLLTTGEVAVLTLLADDHLDWHGSAAAYRHDKLRILGPDPATPTSMVRLALEGEDLPAELGARVTRVSADGDYRHRNTALAVAAVRAELSALGAALPDTDELTCVLDGHYPQLASRFEVVPSDDDITWIDDALGSNPSATAAALERLAPGPAVLICGGHDRGVTLDPVHTALTEWPADALSVIWLGDADDHRVAELAADPAVAGVEAVTSMAAAVKVAAAKAPAGSTVVFSPLAPTQRSMGNWADRSRAFRTAIDQLG